jgi:hypothetical protein
MAMVVLSIWWLMALGATAGSTGKPMSKNADLETVIIDLLDGQYKNPIRVIGLNTAEGWSQNVSADVADELCRRCDLQLRDVPSSISDFVERHAGHVDRQLALRLV